MKKSSMLIGLAALAAVSFAAVATAEMNANTAADSTATTATATDAAVAADASSQTVTGTVTNVDGNKLTIRDDATGDEREITCPVVDPELREGDKVTATMSPENPGEALSVARA